MEERHLEAVAQLEQACFACPWSVSSLRLLLNEPNLAFVVEEDGAVCGYGGLICVLDEGQITNLAVDAAHRRRGFARAILDAMAEHARQNGIVTLSLEVRASNAGAQALYESYGFVQEGVRPRFYTRPVEDAYLMRYDVPGAVSAYEF
jgi:ribosomal-protein-alanine N-acetyltransferase